MPSVHKIRSLFLDYFRTYGHEIVHSSSLVPRNDPSLLFANAGMVQFKHAFLGHSQVGYSRAASSQKCLRVSGKHNDLESVGRTPRHHTFFEMLGNFSFGDYFKAEAIDFAWQFLTKELDLSIGRLYVTVFRDDDEAVDLWKKIANISGERIYRLGEADNFWFMGDTGPCGPCSEILVDQGEFVRCGTNCGIGRCNCGRFLEIWNLVFMQYNQIEPGHRRPLSKLCIDTGMGLERISAVCQGVLSNFDIDIFRGIVDHIANLAGVQYCASEDSDVALRVVADHMRAIAFLIAEGILPSNEGRGYVLRRLIRRAFRFGRFIGLIDPFLHKLVLVVAEKMGVAYPELLDKCNFIARVVAEEEERFSQTLDKGLAMLEKELTAMAGRREFLISGAFAFKLYDTYGFPIDIINDVAGMQGYRVDESDYRVHMGKQKERGRTAWKGSDAADFSVRFSGLLEDVVRDRFLGYDVLEVRSHILRLLDIGGLPVECLGVGDIGWLVVVETPFYTKAGGQVGDVGHISSSTGRANVLDVLRSATGSVGHKVVVIEGEITLEQEVILVVNEVTRLATARNHTATHLLHAALRKVLGVHIRQAGSLVEPDRLRFDFTHTAAMTCEELMAVEREVNGFGLANIAISTSSMAYDVAVSQGAIALFEEQYPDEVRVVTVPGVSVELCGGTHVQATGQMGAFAIVAESGVAAGIRRIEAVTGWNTLAILFQQRQQLAAIACEFKLQCGSQSVDLLSHVRGLGQRIKKMTKELEMVAAKAALDMSGILMGRLEDLAGVKILTAKIDIPNIKAMRCLVDDIRSKLLSGIICLAAEVDGKVLLMLYISKDLHARFTAPSVVKEIAVLVGGSGGGRSDLAQAGGVDPMGIDAAFLRLRELVAQAR